MWALQKMVPWIQKTREVLKKKYPEAYRKYENYVECGYAQRFSDLFTYAYMSNMSPRKAASWIARQSKYMPWLQKKPGA